VTAQTGTSPADIHNALDATRAGRFQEACAIAERALADGGDPVSINALLGMARLDLGETERAIGHLEFAHAHRPLDSRIAADLAGALLALERFDRALEVLTPELAFADPTLQLARMRGAVAVQVRDFDEARAALEHVLARAPNDWESWNNLGNALRGAKDFESSARAFERSLANGPATTGTRFN
jgi:tetratricopeptide (TPR) repeat protein